MGSDHLDGDRLDRAPTLPGKPQAGDSESRANDPSPSLPASFGNVPTLGQGPPSASDLGELVEAWPGAEAGENLESRYELKARIGSGGMGEVWQAVDRRLNRQVAVKRLKPELVRRRGAVERFLKEAQAVARLTHYHIVQVFDFGHDRQGPYIVMEFVDGETLAAKLRRDGPMPAAEAMELAARVCDALALAHQQGIVHRDVKPANILITRQGVPKLTDFGVAHLEGADLGQTQTGAVLGTIDFMAPEQRTDSARADARSDLWSLGATLYQVVTGELPRVILPDRVAASLRPILVKVLDPDPAKRYPTARDLLTALRETGRTAAPPPAYVRPAPTRTPPARHPPPAPVAPVAPLSPSVGERWGSPPRTSCVRKAAKITIVLGVLYALFACWCGVISPLLVSWNFRSASPPAPPEVAAPLLPDPEYVTKPDGATVVVTPSGQELQVLTNSIGMQMVLIPAGEFDMGDDSGDSDERPVHRVRITRPFYLGTTEVTQAQYEQVMGENPGYFTGDPRRPVEQASWDDAQEFCRRLSQKEGKEYRLPTEAEWEYACRAGTTTRFSFGDDEARLGDYAWYDDNSGNSTHPVGQKRPNPWGLYDMHGNVWEWCADRYAEDYYAESPPDDPVGPSSGLVRVLRGGSWNYGPNYARSADRSRYTPVLRFANDGFRAARTL